MIRVMTIEDYDEVYALWKKIRGFGIRSIDDSREGVDRFLKRNPNLAYISKIDFNRHMFSPVDFLRAVYDDFFNQFVDCRGVKLLYIGIPFRKL